MGITTFPPQPALPPGVIAKIASGTMATGYAGISATFPAGKYLIKSDGPIAANFTTSEDANGYSVYSKDGYAIVDVPSTQNFVEVCALKSSENISTSANTLSISNGRSSSFVLGAGSRRNPNAANLQGLGYRSKGTSIVLQFNSQVTWSSSNFGSSAYTGGSNRTYNQITGGKVASNGTSYISYVGQATTSQNQVFVTSTPASGSTYTIVNVTNAGSSSVYGNGVWITHGENSSYSYTTSATPTSGWTTGTFPQVVRWMAFGNGKFVGITSNNQAVYSTNGTSWTTVDTPLPSTSSTDGTWNKIEFINGVFIATPRMPSLSSHIGTASTLISNDGITWRTGQVPLVATSGAAFSNIDLIDIGGFAALVYDPLLSCMFITYDGVELYEIPGNYSTPNYTTHGSRGQAIVHIPQTQPSIGITYSRMNSNFEIYSLDSTYNTY